jgi:hypothetical protein
MKRIITLSTFLLFFAIAFTACEKIAKGKNIPQCIKKKTRKYPSNCLSSVAEYIYMPQGTDKIQSRIYQFYNGYPPCISIDIVLPNYYDEQCNPIDVIEVNDRHIKYNEFFARQFMV